MLISSASPREPQSAPGTGAWCSPSLSTSWAFLLCFWPPRLGLEVRGTGRSVPLRLCPHWLGPSLHHRSGALCVPCLPLAWLHAPSSTEPFTAVRLLLDSPANVFQLDQTQGMCFPAHELEARRKAIKDSWPHQVIDVKCWTPGFCEQRKHWGPLAVHGGVLQPQQQPPPHPIAQGSPSCVDTINTATREGRNSLRAVQVKDI